MRQLRKIRSLSLPWRGVALCLAVLAMLGASAAHATDYHVPYTGNVVTDTNAINAALSTGTGSGNSRIILDYRSNGWTVNPIIMRKAGQELWIAGDATTGSPGKLIANPNLVNTNGFKGAYASLITIQNNDCTVNGYANGTSPAQGVATLQMNKADYVAYTPAFYDPPANSTNVSQYRMGIEINNTTGFSNITIKGVLIRDTGGDGVYVNGGKSGTGYTLTDVSVNGAYRNGMSITSADGLIARNCHFDNSSGASPQSGIDLEPNNSTDRLTNINFWDCTFNGNAADGIHSWLARLTGSNVNPLLDVRFYRCTVDGNGSDGISLASLPADGPSTGSMYFQSVMVSNSAGHGIFVAGWPADHASIIFNNVDVTHAGDNNSTYTGVPIYISYAGGYSGIVTGEILFQNGCSVTDFNPKHEYIISSPNGSQNKDIRGLIHITRSGPGGTIHWGDPDPVNCTLAEE
jgi:hypothetical protein